MSLVYVLRALTLWTVLSVPVGMLVGERLRRCS